MSYIPKSLQIPDVREIVSQKFGFKKCCMWRTIKKSWKWVGKLTVNTFLGAAGQRILWTCCLSEILAFQVWSLKSTTGISETTQTNLNMIKVCCRSNLGSLQAECKVWSLWHCKARLWDHTWYAVPLREVTAAGGLQWCLRCSGLQSFLSSEDEAAECYISHHDVCGSLTPCNPAPSLRRCFAPPCVRNFQGHF